VFNTMSSATKPSASLGRIPVSLINAIKSLDGSLIVKHSICSSLMTFTGTGYLGLIGWSVPVKWMDRKAVTVGISYSLL